MERHNSCLNSRAIIDYIERHYGSPHLLLKGLDEEWGDVDEPLAFLRDAHNWVSAGLLARMYANARELTGDARVAFQIGFESVTHQRLGYIQQILLKAWASPRVAVKRLETINRKFNRTKEVELVTQESDHALVRLHWLGDLEISDDFCLMNQGIYSAIPTIWGLPPARVEETKCQFEGDDYCEFDIRWRNPSLVQRVRLLIHNQRSLLSESLAEIEHDKQLLEHKYSEVQALNRQLMRKIEQILAIQQASGAILSELDYGKLIPNVLTLFLRTIGYQRAMIMLVDESQQMLRFEEGVGMDPSDLAPMDGYSVPLDRSSNLLARVAQSGQPLISHDAAQLNLNPKNIIIRKYQPQAIVILPLTAQGRVIGILAADRPEGEETVTSMDRDYLGVFANQVALAIENARMYRDLKESFLSTVKSLAQALEAKDPYTRGHSERVTSYAVRLATRLGMPEGEVGMLERLGMLHDVGKIALDRQILNKASKLSDEDMEMVRMHPAWGESIIQPLKLTKEEMAIVRHHHERYDGGGYPDGLAGNAIPMPARVISVADAFDAMTSDRPYRKAMGLRDALAELDQGAGSQFDRKVVQAFAAMVREGRVDDLLPRHREDNLRHLNLAKP
ncbi:MAG: HD domain-containing protein [Desulfarculaceae bacterium]|nr:HD domain-containing protein [Desulfarculaceae bacterium]MCF8071307.1 HD domain-containing protein [Desulfarculaceae bacterium]MCF8101632.1 HD domain-containing protein [Desulfarculaceae bacterium]MCF8117428.1 HD domain-containing protein [Desulfarculaceae bacterium]